MILKVKNEKNIEIKLKVNNINNQKLDKNFN